MSGTLLQGTLREIDPRLSDLFDIESARQERKLILIASESMCPDAVREALASEFGHLYAEGYPSMKMCAEDETRLCDHAEQLSYIRRYSDRRYYKGVELVDFVESLARRRMAEAFATPDVPAASIHANVQPLSGAAANNAVYNAFASPGDVVMGMSLQSGGHLTHGSPVNRSGRTHRIVSYTVGPDGRLDYAAIRKLALAARPKILIGGFSAYPWDIDWAEFRKIADEAGAILLADIAHTAGLVAAGVVRSPLGHAHVVSFTTHKSFCGPRGACLLSTHPEIARKLDVGVFPGEQGGPHVHQIAGKAVAAKLAATPPFHALMRRVAENAKALAAGLVEEGLALAYGGTDTHLVLVDLKKLPSPTGTVLSGETASRILDLVGLTCNKNTIQGDTSAVHPTAVRFGTVWASQRGLGPADMTTVARIAARVLRAIHPYHYLGGASPIGRGKIDLEVLETARREVDDLLAHFPTAAPAPALGYPYLLEPRVEKPATQARLEVSGARAPHLLDGACTADVRSVEVGGAVETLLLDRKGTALAAGTVTRTAPRPDGAPRFELDLAGPAAGNAAAWLRALSDGYVLHDDDLLLKVEGPAKVVELEAGPGAAPKGPPGEVTFSDKRIFAGKPYFIGRRAMRRSGEWLAPGREAFRWTPPAAEPRKTCLYEEHLKRANKRMIVPFAGWMMPVWFQGIAQEHEAVRTRAGLFDVSHMGTMELEGPDAERFLDLVTVNYVAMLRIGQAHYSYLLDPDGRVIDDILVYRRGDEKFFVVVNAANAEEDEAWLRAAASGKFLLDRKDPGLEPPRRLVIRNLKELSSGDDRRVDLALQGPSALPTLLALAGPGKFAGRIERLGRFEFSEGLLDGVPAIVSRTGYTGEDVGFELYLHPDAAPRIWNLLLEKGAPLGVVPAGLGARDSTRTEAGLPLHGHELAGGNAVNPVEAGYGSFVRLHKPFFVGREQMVEAATKPRRVIVRFRVGEQGGKMIRPGNVVVDGRRGDFAGTVTSCTAVDGYQYGMALVDPSLAAPGTKLSVFAMSEKDKMPPCKTLAELRPGDRVVVPRDAVVVTRFAARDAATGKLTYDRTAV
ncbi:MAG: serine hydroxymethyltransferase [Deltaproteobacteria bacterium]|nr:serine hydroxymethyltransferase [Deltaproteobacteria bacterium]